MKIEKLFYAGMIASAMFLSACSDEVTNNPTPALGKNCTIEKVTTGKNSFTFTYEASVLKSVTEKLESSTTVYNMVYTAGKLTQITSASTNYDLTYTGNNVTMVNEKDAKSGVIEYEYAIEYDANNKLKKVTTTFIDAGTRTLEEVFTYTFNGNNVSQVLNSIDTDGDGTLNTEYDVTFKFTSFDEKINPYYNLPLYFTDFSNFQFLSKNNMLTGAIEVLSEQTPLISTYTYNTSDYPVQISAQSGSGAAAVSNITYNCK